MHPFPKALRSDTPRLVSTSQTRLSPFLTRLPVGTLSHMRSTLENDNLRHEYVSLFSQVQRDIPFARIALEKEPEAINMW